MHKSDSEIYQDYIRSRGKLQFPIAWMAPKGYENRIPAKTLAAYCGYKSVRDLQKRIQSERGTYPLLLSSADGGYFRPDDGEKGDLEIAKFIVTLSRRAGNTYKTVRAAREELQKRTGRDQLHLDMDVSEAEVAAHNGL